VNDKVTDIETVFTQSGYGVVYFGNDWFAENRTSSHHIARRLAKHVPLLYVDSPGLRAPNTSGRDLKRLWRKLVDAVRLPRQLDENFWHCTVPQIPYRRVPGVNILNQIFGLWAVRRALRHVGFKKRISWFVVPHPGFMAKRLQEVMCVYYCIDDYAAHPGVNAVQVAESDRALTRAADQVFVAPPALLAIKQTQNANTVFAPHGVDVELFGRAMNPDTIVPEAARTLPGPVIGYFGSIAAWIDVELIEWLAQSRPQWSFLLVGHSFVDVSALKSLRNVTLVGPQPYESLPNWAKAFDVAIIPYRLNQQVKNANPLKLREYLATGCPIVTVSNPEIERFSQWVRIVDGRAAFLAAIEHALLPEPIEAAHARIAAVEKMTWDHRVQEVLSTVTQHPRFRM
jgi:glycosyltransferase involved in cell wall biosynthesis